MASRMTPPSFLLLSAVRDRKNQQRLDIEAALARIKARIDELNAAIVRLRYSSARPKDYGETATSAPSCCVLCRAEPPSCEAT